MQPGYAETVPPPTGAADPTPVPPPTEAADPPIWAQRFRKVRFLPDKSEPLSPAALKVDSVAWLTDTPARRRRGNPGATRRDLTTTTRPREHHPGVFQCASHGRLPPPGLGRPEVTEAPMHTKPRGPAGPAAPACDPPADHRRLGRALRLVGPDPLARGRRAGRRRLSAPPPAAAAALPLWLPDGAVIRAELERLAAEEAIRGGCQPGYTPVLAKRALFDRSGHWDQVQA